MSGFFASTLIDNDAPMNLGKADSSILFNFNVDRNGINLDKTHCAMSDRKERLIKTMNIIKENKTDFNILYAELNGEIFLEEIEFGEPIGNKYLTDLIHIRDNQANSYRQAVSREYLNTVSKLAAFTGAFEVAIHNEIQKT